MLKHRIKQKQNKPRSNRLDSSEQTASATSSLQDYDWLQYRPLVRRIARYLHQQSLLTLFDQEDIEQELWMRFWARRNHYDESKSSRSTFIAVVVERSAIDLLRYENARKRHHGPDIGLSDGETAKDKIWLDDLILDIKELLENLPENMQDLARAILNSETVTGYARHRGIGRGKVRGQMENLKRHLIDHDLGPIQE